MKIEEGCFLCLTHCLFTCSQRFPSLSFTLSGELHTQTQFVLLVFFEKEKKEEEDKTFSVFSQLGPDVSGLAA